MAPNLLGGLTPRTFLQRHWQKRPLLVRAAFAPFRDPLTPARLLSLATRADVESRLVRERGGDRPWQVEPGPLPRSRLRQLGPSHWTVLVQNVDEHVPAVAGLLEAFDFLPRWRVDDVMVSLAARQGSVGPHVDTYDVFLLQGRGRRRWRIAEHFDLAYRPGLDLRVLRAFRAEQDWVLAPGDMLYLPPGVAHHGIALEECLTYSIGLRAPSEVDLVAGFLQRVVGSVDQSRLYADPDHAPAREPGEISARALERMRAAVARAAEVKRPAFVRFAGDHLTERRRPRAGRVPAVDVSALSLAPPLGIVASPAVGSPRRLRQGRRGHVALCRRPPLAAGGRGRARGPGVDARPPREGGVDSSLRPPARLRGSGRRAHRRRRVPRGRERPGLCRRRAIAAWKSAGSALETVSRAPVSGCRSCKRAAWSITRGASRRSPP